MRALLPAILRSNPIREAVGNDRLVLGTTDTLVCRYAAASSTRRAGVPIVLQRHNPATWVEFKSTREAVGNDRLVYWETDKNGTRLSRNDEAGEGSRQRPGVRWPSTAFEHPRVCGKLQRAGALQDADAGMTT